MKNAKNLMASFFIASFFYAGLFGFAERFSMDRLYPQNYFTKAREQCMQIWGALDELLTFNQPTVESNLLVDAVIGKVALAKNCIKDLCRKPQPVSSDNLVDLSRIIGTIQHRSERLSRTVVGDKLTFVKKIANKLRLTMQQIINKL